MTTIQSEAFSSAIKQFAEAIDSERDIALATAELTEASKNVPLKNLDEWERYICVVLDAPTETRQKRWSWTWKRKADRSTHSKWTDICSRNGYVREAAIWNLKDEISSPFIFALVIRRLNDWVPQVQMATRKRLLLIAQDTDPKIVEEAISTIYGQATSWSRLEEEDHKVLSDIACMKEISSRIIQRILSSTSGSMTSLFNLLGRTDTLDDYILEIAKKAVQPTVRAIAFSCILEQKISWVIGRKWEWIDQRYLKGSFKNQYSVRDLHFSGSINEVLKIAALDKSPIVRRVAASKFISIMESFGADAITLAEGFALDRSPSVAEKGRFAFEKYARIHNPSNLSQ